MNATGLITAEQAIIHAFLYYTFTKTETQRGDQA